jgi:hypothetical protein
VLGTITTWDEEMRALLGEHTALAIKPGNIKLRSGEPNRISIIPPMPSVFSMDASAIPESIEYHVATIFHLVAGLDEPDLARLRHLLFMRIERDGYRETEVCYGISEQHWHFLKERGEHGKQVLRRIVEQVIPDMTRILTKPPERKKHATGR